MRPAAERPLSSAFFAGLSARSARQAQETFECRGLHGSWEEARQDVALQITRSLLAEHHLTLQATWGRSAGIRTANLDVQNAAGETLQTIGGLQVLGDDPDEVLVHLEAEPLARVLSRHRTNLPALFEAPAARGQEAFLISIDLDSAACAGAHARSEAQRRYGFQAEMTWEPLDLQGRSLHARVTVRFPPPDAQPVWKKLKS